MKTGYYWAKLDKESEWEIVQIKTEENGKQYLVRVGSTCKSGLDAVLEWGGRIVRGSNVIMNQYGANCTQITNVGTLTIK